MKTLLMSVAFAALIAGPVAASTVDYNTSTSTLSCNGVAGCVQNTPDSISLGGLNLIYTPGAGSGVATPSNINLGNLMTSGAPGSAVDLSGLLLTLNITSSPPGSTLAIPGGTISGAISTTSSSAFVNFGSGVVTIGQFLYQVQNTSLGIQAPTVGNPLGQTTIQGEVSEAVVQQTGTPEPASWALMIAGFAGIGFSLRLRRSMA